MIINLPHVHPIADTVRNLRRRVLNDLGCELATAVVFACFNALDFLGLWLLKCRGWLRRLLKIQT
jgi:hypothetical protein